MITALLASLALGAAPLPQDPQTPAPPPVQEDGVTLEDVTVTGRPLDQLIRNFVNEVAAPVRGRGLARWDRSVCVGVANLRNDVAQYIVDRVSTVAEDIGLQAGEPGCTPLLLVVAASDGQALAREMAEEHRRALRLGASGVDRGGDAFERFQTQDRPIRWWQVSMPVDSETGDRAVYLPGECRGACTSAMDQAPVINVFAASRLRTQIVDQMYRTIIIVDVDEVSDLDGQQLADYIAMVGLAQIDPEADTSAYASILNVFNDPAAAPGLTDWDKAYLTGLYSAERNAVSRLVNRSEIADTIRDAHDAQRAEPQPDSED